jgi:hypothetical protein
VRARYLIAGILIGIVISAAGLGRARGEFKTVPRWWVRQAMCVHHGEGSWRDPNAPYYGGMQLDMTSCGTTEAGCSSITGRRTTGRSEPS